MASGKTQLLSCLLLGCLFQLSTGLVFWTAVVEISYTNSQNETIDKYCECGIFGRNAAVERAQGVVTLPSGDPKGCGPDPVYSRHADSPPWIALVKRGNCTFSEKINAARLQGAQAVVIYNVDGSGNLTQHMSHPDTANTVAIMIGNLQGMEIVKLIQNSTGVQMIIEVGSPHGPWMDTYWLYFLSIAFFIVVTASIAYFVFISANRLYSLRRHKRAENRLKSEAKKAIRRLEVRTLKRGDEETTSEVLLCAVCIEAYKAGDVVTVLTCDHIFHKACIEPWLLERRTCPMCKCDILKALGVEEESKPEFNQSSPPEVTVITVAGGEAMYEVPLTDTASPHYDNRAFEGEPARG
ncbi:E3 ubiquitin-protein ligase RNF128a [Eucyclogobius newberryi]|uniref:E3 ubiquitin-protein ligase RNF128a n=1 Tax=Eucyclogobius newberryi TaxID=166745 RepID=UPI003B5A6D12